MNFDFDVDVKNGILLGFLLLAGGFLAVQAYWPSLKSNGFARCAVSLRCLVCLLLVLLLMEPILAFTMHRHRRPLVALMVLGWSIRGKYMVHTDKLPLNKCF